MSATVRIKTTKPFGDSTVSKILDLVENSSMKKAKSEKFISKFARYYTPAVCFSALALAIIPPLVRIALGVDAMWSEWIYRALTFLVISCPCALVISIPLTFFAGIGGASKEGILVKGASYLETLSKIAEILECDIIDFLDGSAENSSRYLSDDLRTIFNQLNTTNKKNILGICEVLLKSQSER